MENNQIIVESFQELHFHFKNILNFKPILIIGTCTLKRGREREGHLLQFLHVNMAINMVIRHTTHLFYIKYKKSGLHCTLLHLRCQIQTSRCNQTRIIVWHALPGNEFRVKTKFSLQNIHIQKIQGPTRTNNSMFFRRTYRKKVIQ